MTVNENVITEEAQGSATDFTEQFSEAIEHLSKIGFADLPDAEDRVEQCDELIEEHYAITGRLPDKRHLSKLSDFILAGDLKDSSVDKVTNTEYPILSTTQLVRRESKQVSMETDNLNYLDSKYNKRLDSLSKRSTANLEEV